MIIVEPDFDEHLEIEALTAPRVLTSRLYHYTSARAAIGGILPSGRLWLSPFSSTNDLWESRPTYPTLQAHEDDSAEFPGFDLWEQLDLEMRRRAKVACFTQDWHLPDYVFNPEAQRGWAHLAIWAHYGDSHRGILLQFDRDSLISALLDSVGDDSRAYHGPVLYRSVTSGAGPVGIDVGQVKEFGVDAVAAHFAGRRGGEMYFKKHSDWSYENEFRVVRVDQSTERYELDIRAALTGVVLGVNFPHDQLVPLSRALEPYPGLEVARLGFHNRRLMSFPVDTLDPAAHVPNSSAPPDAPAVVARRAGPLADRLSALQASEKRAAELELIAQVTTADGQQKVAQSFAEMLEEAASWRGVEVQRFERVTAIPPSMRRRSAGTPGEVTHFQWGQLLVVHPISPREAGPDLTLAAAFQVLDEERVRIHAVANIDTHPAQELWRSEIDSTIQDLSRDMGDLRPRLHAALSTLRHRL